MRLRINDLAEFRECKSILSSRVEFMVPNLQALKEVCKVENKCVIVSKYWSLDNLKLLENEKLNEFFVDLEKI